MQLVSRELNLGREENKTGGRVHEKYIFQYTTASGRSVTAIRVMDLR